MSLLEWVARLFGYAPPKAPPVSAPVGVVTPPEIAVTAPFSTSIPAYLLSPSAGCLELVKHFESFSPSAYPDPASPLGQACTKAGIPVTGYTRMMRWDGLSGAPWTVGFGETGDGINPYTKRSYGDALRILQSRIETKGKFLSDHLSGLLITQGAFDALVSFYDNVGYGRPGEKDGLFILKSGEKSTLLKLTEAGDFTGAAEEFAKWTKAQGIELAGLVRRRKAEQAMYLSQDWHQFTT